ncbi:MAG: orotidine 5'-phosphate decarboxylase [Coriobacteriales bacterium]|jgi:orotidine-5'-phosphate decarboxylase|nr:orotidine 5'-phosphate decarboxylase [Coriobacteriales bacterium]
MNAADKLIVALDLPRQQADEQVRQLTGVAKWLKVGMTLYYRSGPSVIHSYREQGFFVFADLKLHDIPHQVKGAAAALTAAKADMISVHASGGLEMMRAALAGIHEATYEATEPHDAFDAREAAAEPHDAFDAREVATANDATNQQRRPLCVAITVLTSLNDADLAMQGIHARPSEQAARLADLAMRAGMDGIVCSPAETQAMRRELGEQAVIVTPGIRPAGVAVDDQKRQATPTQALRAGASYLVVGRPVTQADDPKSALRDILNDLGNA